TRARRRQADGASGLVVNGAWVCLLAPLAGFLAITLAGDRITRRQAGILSTASVFVGFAGAVVAFIDALSREPDDRAVTTTAWTWLAAGDFKVSIDLLVDPLSITMMLVVTGIGGFIVLYSNGYMEGEDEERRYFAYMSLFVFSMLMLVMGGNLLLLLVGWGLVGPASYLVIVFYHDRSSAIDAAKKAFVINTIGDAAMALALFLAIAKVRSRDYSNVFDAAQSGELSDTVVTLLALGLLAGAVAKSAQIPLHTWLPDAMEGPTPVSALIHAATMVTAGVYLVARTHVLFENAPDIQSLVALIGVATLLMAGVIALVQTDIKRIIAYSTMSQIGYMFAAVGVGAYSSGMYHLLTHAFFKALLFLGAGIVIHALSGEQDVRRMGGLASALPRTAGLMWIGTIALIGFWPLSKDGILAAELQKGGTIATIVWVGGLIGAFLTGIYATRLMRLTFYGLRSTYADVHLHETSHGEARGPMFWRVPALAAGAVLSGFLAIGFGTRDEIASWLRFVAPAIEASTGNDVVTTAIAWGAGLAGAALVWWAYAKPERLARITRPLTGGAVVAENLFYWDTAYRFIAYLPASVAASTLYRWFER